MSTTFPITIGIDDIATETQECSGFTVFSLPNLYISDFENDAKAILDANPKIQVFHAKEFKPKQSESYRDFLQLIRDYASKSLQASAHCQLLSRGTKKTVEQKWDSLLSRTIHNLKLPELQTKKLLLPYLPVLEVMARALQELGDNIEATVHLDSGSEYKDLKSVIHQSSCVQITGETILTGIYNGMKKKLYPKAPSLAHGQLKVLSDSESFLIQAADVIGNFAMADIFTRLGSISKTKSAKASLMNEVFGDIMDQVSFPKSLSIQGHDLVVTEPYGVVKFALHWPQMPSNDNH